MPDKVEPNEFGPDGRKPASRINPYAPVEIRDHPAVIPIEGEGVVEFDLNASQLRKAEEQCLLINFVGRLSLGSILMILASLVAMGAAMQFGELAFLAAAVASMFGSAIVYLSLIHRPKMTLRARLADFGVLSGAACSLRIEADQLTFSSPTGSFVWPCDSIRAVKRPQGLLLWSEPLMFVFVPRRARFFGDDYESFCKRVIEQTSSSKRKRKLGRGMGSVGPATSAGD